MSGTIARDKVDRRRATYHGTLPESGTNNQRSSPSRTCVGHMGEIATDFRMHAGWTFIKTG